MIRKEASAVQDSDGEIEIVKADNHASTSNNQSSLYTSLLQQKIETEIQGVPSEAPDVEDEPFDKSKVQKRPEHTFGDGSTYEGQWMGDEMHGTGCLKKNGTVYFGDMRHNLRSGSGRFTYENGDSYDGCWKNDKFNGYGVFYDHFGNRHAGQWKNGAQHGEFEDELQDGTVFKGVYENGVKVSGKTTYEDGSTHTGSWLNGKFDGPGEYIWANGMRYSGDYKDHHMEGKGVMIWPDGRKYEGDWELDERHGFGVMWQPDGKKYDGGWRNGQRHGEATVTTKDGQVKVGIFDNGKVGKWFDTEELNQRLEEIRKQKLEREKIEKEKKAIEENLARQNAEHDASKKQLDEKTKTILELMKQVEQLNTTIEELKDYQKQLEEDLESQVEGNAVKLQEIEGLEEETIFLQETLENEKKEKQKVILERDELRSANAD